MNGELVSKLDSKTAKTGDSVVVQTKRGIKTPDGTEIPKGSKVVGHVIAVRPSQSGQNSQMALVFDRVELKGGKAMPVHSQIQSISPPEGAASASGSLSPSAPERRERGCRRERAWRRGSTIRRRSAKRGWRWACLRGQRRSRTGDTGRRKRRDCNTDHLDSRGTGREQRPRATRSQDGGRFQHSAGVQGEISTWMGAR